MNPWFRLVGIVGDLAALARDAVRRRRGKRMQPYEPPEVTQDPCPPAAAPGEPPIHEEKSG